MIKRSFTFLLTVIFPAVTLALSPETNLPKPKTVHEAIAKIENAVKEGDFLSAISTASFWVGDLEQEGLDDVIRAIKNPLVGLELYEVKPTGFLKVEILDILPPDRRLIEEGEQKAEDAMRVRVKYIGAAGVELPMGPPIIFSGTAFPKRLKTEKPAIHFLTSGKEKALPLLEVYQQVKGYSSPEEAWQALETAFRERNPLRVVEEVRNLTGGEYSPAKMRAFFDLANLQDNTRYFEALKALERASQKGFESLDKLLKSLKSDKNGKRISQVEAGKKWGINQRLFLKALYDYLVELSEQEAAVPASVPTVDTQEKRPVSEEVKDLITQSHKVKEGDYTFQSIVFPSYDGKSSTLTVLVFKGEKLLYSFQRTWVKAESDKQKPIRLLRYRRPAKLTEELEKDSLIFKELSRKLVIEDSDAEHPEPIAFKFGDFETLPPQPAISLFSREVAERMKQPKARSLVAFKGALEIIKNQLPDYEQSREQYRDFYAGMMTELGWGSAHFRLWIAAAPLDEEYPLPALEQTRVDYQQREETYSVFTVHVKRAAPPVKTLAVYHSSGNMIYLASRITLDSPQNDANPLWIEFIDRTHKKEIDRIKAEPPFRTLFKENVSARAQQPLRTMELSQHYQSANDRTRYLIFPPLIAAYLKARDTAPLGHKKDHIRSAYREIASLYETYGGEEEFDAVLSGFSDLLIKIGDPLRAANHDSENFESEKSL